MRRSLPLFALLVACAGLGGACVVRPAPDWGDNVGTVSAELSTVGPDGATYALPSTATLTLIESGGFTTTVPLSGAPTETFSVPEGAYSATLSNGDAGTTWRLTRQADGGSTSIDAVLTDAMPISFTVTVGQVTSLVFHFATVTLGNVAFGTGGVGVGTALDAGAFPLSTAKITGTSSMTVDTLAGSATFDRALRFTGSVSVPYTLNLTRSGGWTIASHQACAPVSGTATSTSSNQALASIFSEASHGSGTICFGDPTLSGAFNVDLARTGQPTTSTMRTDLPAGGTFEIAVSGLAPEVFDGTTLHLASLHEPFTATNVEVSELVSAGGVILCDISGAPSGTASVTLKP